MSKKLYGKELANTLIKERTRIQGIMANRDSRINQGMTDDNDCFMSIKVNQQALREIEMQLEILSGDGLFETDGLFDEDGGEIAMRWVTTQYGQRIVADGIFAKDKETLVKKTGYELRKIKAPCWTKYITHGTGLCGVYTGYYIKMRWHTNMVTGKYVGYPN